MTVRKESEQCGLQVPEHKDYASNDSTTCCLCICGPLALGNCAYFRLIFPEARIGHTTSPIGCRSIVLNALAVSIPMSDLVESSKSLLQTRHGYKSHQRYSVSHMKLMKVVSDEAVGESVR
jgi:hypothetical protein